MHDEKKADPAMEARLSQKRQPNESAPVRLQTYVDSLTNSKTDPRIYPNLPSLPWFDAANIPLACALEKAYQNIRTEVLALEENMFRDENEPIERQGKWDVVVLFQSGTNDIVVASRCPTISRIVNEFRDIIEHAGLVYVSRMRPGTHIAPHRGPTNMRLRCHLGIVVPSGDCFLRVAGETRSWSEAQCMVFDDFFEHEAWNHTDSDRIVLIVDMWHPTLTAPEREFLKGMCISTSAMVARAEKQS